jgi:hypothetical protein
MAKELFKVEIEIFFNNPNIQDGDVLNLPYIPLNEYSKILAELGCSTLNENGSLNLMGDGNDFDTHGWQVDFRWHFKREEQSYCLSGSLFYGNFKLRKGI